MVFILKYYTGTPTKIRAVNVTMPLIVINERHLRKILRSYLAYCDDSRTHLGLAGECPKPREVEPAERGSVVALPVLCGLHHRYTRHAA